MTKFDHKALAEKWRKKWEESDLYEVDLENAANPYYNLMMFPYPSAEGMHIGSMRTFAGIDAYGRFHRLQGKDVFQPFGLDGFGIHAENYAIKIDKHPVKQAKITEERYYEQFKMIGNGFPARNKLETYDPDYYRWTQWLFIQMYKNGLAERKESYVNWCPSCKTVLADEQVINGKCERCDSETTKRKTEQWFFNITNYAQRLLDNIDKIDWPQSIKQSQRNWIGKKEGINITYPIVGTDETVTCFTTRPDTNFGATFIVLGPEHPLLQEGKLEIENRKEVDDYIDRAKSKTELERVAEGTAKTGVFTGHYAKNPLNDREMPIYVSDFVLGHVGTGAVVGVPGHDTRDFEFAQVFDLPVINVVKKENPPVLRSYLMGAEKISNEELEELGITIESTTESGSRRIEIPSKIYSKYQELVKQKLNNGYWNEVLGEDIWFLFKNKKGDLQEFVLDDSNRDKIAALCSEYNGDYLEKTSNIYLYLGSNDWYTDYLINEDQGVMVNSEFLDGLDIHDATEKMMDHMEEEGWGERTVSWHLRDWLISRQRYWGPPIPMVHCEQCGWNPVPEDELPVELPYVEDYRPTGEGKSPLEMADEAWLHTECPECGGQAKRETDVSDNFLDSAWYFLAYPNLNEEEWGKGDSPFNDSTTSRWLPVDAYIGGAEHAVLHLLYSRFVTMALHDWGFLNFSDIGEPFPYLVSHGLVLKDGVKMSKSKGNVVVPDDCVEKFGADAVRMYLAFTGPFESDGDFRDEGMEAMAKFVERIWDMYQDDDNFANKTTPKTKQQLHRSIKRVQDDILRFKYNTAISAVMEVVNSWKEEGETMTKEDASKFLQIFSPFAVFMTEELWQQLGNDGNIHFSSWPEYDAELAKGDEITIVIQVDGKVRGALELERKEKSWTEEEVVELAKAQESIEKYLEAGIKKTIYIDNKLVNFVT